MTVEGLHPLVIPVLRENFLRAQGDACRLFHGRGRTFPDYQHLSIDYFHPLVLITLFAQVEDDWLQSLVTAVKAVVEPHGITAIAVQQRYAKGAPLQLAWGKLPHKLAAREAGLNFGLQLGGRQNLGFFLDMAAARQWLSERAAGKRVLNLFAYTCAFSVVARAAGATQVVNLDMSASALRQGQQNHQRNGILGGAQFLSHDLFKSWGKLRRLGPFDLIIVDPPSRQPGSFVADRDYSRVLQKLPALCAADAQLLLCLNSPHLETGFLRAEVATQAAEFEYQERLPNPPGFVDENPELSLKVLSYRYISPEPLS
jgi:23S rRNA (cytosine1962-C5)-methyltransferase